MDESLFSEKAQRFLQAWMEHDLAAERISVSIGVSRQNDGGYRPGLLTLKVETDELVDSTAPLAEELGVNAVHLMRVLHELRREGMNHSQALTSVLRYLDHNYPLN